MTSESAMSNDLNVFISSTFSDLKEYRQAVAESLARLNLHAVGIEAFGASDESPLKAGLNALDASDIVVVIVAWRIGYIPPGDGRSLIELEYDRAVEAGKPTLCFLLAEEQPWPPSLMDPDLQRVQAFRRRLMADRLVNVFRTVDDLVRAIAVAVANFSSTAARALREVPSPAAPVVAEPGMSDLLAELKAIRVDMSLLQQLVVDGAQRAAKASLDPGDCSDNRPASFLGAAAHVDAERCFVIMPYSQPWSGAVERIIREVCAEVGLTFEIAKNMLSRFVPHDIWQGITAGGIIVADLSGANANVAYEVGLADAIGKNVVLIAQETDVPFDFQAQRLIRYENTLPGSLALREELKDRLERHKARSRAAGDVA